jgi:hypothetical protein
VEKRVLTVLRSGGEYEPKHVLAIKRQLAQWCPDVTFACLTDAEVPGVDCIPLKHKWRGWFAKLELFRPELSSGFLYTDLDNVIVGPIDDMFRSVYTTQQFGWNALMYVPPRFGHQVYEAFAAHPTAYSEEWFGQRGYGEPFGDAGFIRQYVTGEAWEQVLPGQVVNIVDLIVRWPYTHIGCDSRTYPYRQPAPGTRVVLCANKRRRPWKLPLFSHLYQEKS